MKNYFKNEKGGFLQIVVLIVIALVLMRFFGITISGTLAYLNLTWADILGGLLVVLDWFKDLWNSVK
jgi:hypothetical protein